MSAITPYSITPPLPSVFFQQTERAASTSPLQGNRHQIVPPLLFQSNPFSALGVQHVPVYDPVSTQFHFVQPLTPFVPFAPPPPPRVHTVTIETGGEVRSEVPWEFSPLPSHTASQAPIAKPMQAPNLPHRLANPLTPEVQKTMEYFPEEPIKKFGCKVCLKKLDRKALLKIHIRTHTGERPYGCKYCPKKFKSVKVRNEHERSTHNARRFKCLYPGCTSTFSWQRDLNTHWKVHDATEISASQALIAEPGLANPLTPEEQKTMEYFPEEPIKKFGCKACLRRFVWKSFLKTHIRAHHTGERPYECKYCDKKFKHAGNLKDHHRRHNNERLFKCSHLGCTSAFFRQDELNTHRKTHDVKIAEPPRKKAKARVRPR